MILCGQWRLLVWGERSHEDLLIVYGGGELGWVSVLPMAWEYGASGRGRISGMAWRAGDLLG